MLSMSCQHALPDAVSRHATLCMVWVADVRQRHGGVLMETLYLQTFLRVVERGNFTRVADELFLTPPGVRQQIRALERHFDVRLFDIVAHRPVLTEAGMFLASRAQGIVESVGALDRDMAEFAQVQAGQLRVGASLTIGEYVLPALLARFRAAYPQVHVQVEIANTAAIAEQVRRGCLSLGLIEGPLDDPAMVSTPFRDDHLLLVVPPAHRLAAVGVVDLPDLASEMFVTREPGSGTRDLMEQTLARAGIQPRVLLELSSGEGLTRAVEAGLGIAILSHIVVERAVADQRVVPVIIKDVVLQRTFRLIALRGRTVAPAARAFTAVVTEHPAI